jgi:SAM-dependent methyltransferase
MDRRQRILSMFDPSGFGLEIGPSYNPLLPKAEGYKVETLDYTDQIGLRLKYADNPSIDVSKIEPVDFVSDGRSMADLIGATGRYDFIVASHVIEHTPDMIGFLKDCERLLKPDGVLALAVPDKRCCFDFFQTLTSTGELLEVHRSGRTRPAFGALFNAVAYGVKQDGQIGWELASRGRRELAQPLASAMQLATDTEESGIYRDVHVWRFVPSSFELIMNDLYEVGETTLRIASMDVAGEFLVALSRQGCGPSRSRLDLLEAIVEEQAVCADVGQGRGLKESPVPQAYLLDRPRLARRFRLDSREACRQLERTVHALAALAFKRLTGPLRRTVRVILNAWSARS